MILLAVAAFGAGFARAQLRNLRANWQAQPLAQHSPERSDEACLHDNTGSEDSSSTLLAIKQLKQGLGGRPGSSPCSTVSGSDADCASAPEDAIPWLCELLQGSEDEEVLAGTTELVALLSPSWRGLQSALAQAGAVDALLRLLRLYGSDLCDEDSNAQHDGGRCVMKEQAAAAAGCVGDAAAAARTARGVPEGTGSELRVEGGAQGDGRGSSTAVRRRTDVQHNTAVQRRTAVLCAVLRSLVNLTATRAGNAVRLAILRDDHAMPVLLRLLRAAAAPTPTPSRAVQHRAHRATQQSMYDTCVAGTRAAGPHVGSVTESLEEEDDDEAWEAAAAWEEDNAAYDADAPLTAAARGDDADIAASAADATSPTHGSRAPCTAAPVGAWQAAGLAAWLAAHLGRVPAGQAALEEEGGVAALVALVRAGRAVWQASAATAASPSPSTAPSSSRRTLGPDGAAGCDPACVGKGGAEGGGGGERGRADGPAGDDEGDCGRDEYGAALPYVAAALQNGLMALVNATYEHSRNQRAAAAAGCLAELDALLAVVLALEGRGRAHPLHADGEAGAAREEAAAAAQGVARFAVWLAAHLSSSAPDLKAAIAGPRYSLVPNLLALLLQPHQGGVPPPPPSPPHHDQQLQQQEGQRGTEASSPPSAPSAAASAAAAAAAAGRLSVRQYAAMALVNLTCGVPSTKAAVAAAVDWAAMADMLSWLAAAAGVPPPASSASSPAAPHAHAAATSATPPSASASALSSPQQDAIAELLAYSVWLLQHLSLSPVAAAATDPRVVPPLVRLLRAPDPHVRLRAVAALGALCSVSERAAGAATAGCNAHASACATPPRRAGGTVCATMCNASSGSAQQQQPEQPRSHRAAFLAAGGVRQLLEMASEEQDEQIASYGMMCLAAAVGEGDAGAAVEAAGAGALGLLGRLLGSEHPVCLVAAAEALQHVLAPWYPVQALARAVAPPASPSRHNPTTSLTAIASAAADCVPYGLLARLVHVVLTHADPRVRAAAHDALGALAALPGLAPRHVAAVAEALRDLVCSAEVELRVIPVS